MLKAFNFVESFLWSKVCSHQPEINYCVTSISASSTNDSVIQCISHPSTSILSLVQSHSASCYQVILKQHELQFILAQCKGADKGREAMAAINTTLAPFLKQGPITFSKQLLQSTLLPHPPTNTTDLITRMIETMEHKPHLFPDWYKIAQVLMTLSSHSTTNDDTISLPPPAPIDSLYKTSPAINETVTMDTSTHTSTRTHLSPLVIVNKEELTNDTDEEYHTPTWDGPGDPFPYCNTPTNPLLISLDKGYINSCLHLLLGGADPNQCLDSDGNTPLHIAATKGDITLLKLLIAFEADPRFPNNNGQLPVDQALKVCAYDCALLLKEVLKLLDVADNLSLQYDKEKTEKKNQDSSYLLSLDGGGVRAIMEIQVLIAIEKRMRKIQGPSNTPVSILNTFDYIAGTSGGAYVLFITIFGKRDLIEARSLVFSAMNRLSQTSGLNERGRVLVLENILKGMLGEEMVMSGVKSPRVMITATLADRSPCRLHLMTNYGGARDGQLGPSERRVWEAARITSAVPLYLGSYDGKFLDGGLMSNNPTLDAMTEVISNEKSKLGLVLSLGSGKCDEKSLSTVDCSIPTWSLSSLLQLPHSLKGLKNLGEILLMQLTGSDGQEVERCKAWCTNMGTKYHRISPLMCTSHLLNESNTSNIIGMLYDAQLHVLKEAETIDNIAKTLLLKHT